MHYTEACFKSRVKPYQAVLKQRHATFFRTQLSKIIFYVILLAGNAIVHTSAGERLSRVLSLRWCLGWTERAWTDNTPHSALTMKLTTPTLMKKTKFIQQFWNLSRYAGKRTRIHPNIHKMRHSIVSNLERFVFFSGSVMKSGVWCIFSWEKFVQRFIQHVNILERSCVNFSSV